MNLNNLLATSHSNYIEFFDTLHNPLFNGWITRMDVLNLIYQYPAFGRTEIELMPNSTFFYEKVIIKSWESVGIESIITGLYAF